MTQHEIDLRIYALQRQDGATKNQAKTWINLLMMEISDNAEEAWASMSKAERQSYIRDTIEGAAWIPHDESEVRDRVIELLSAAEAHGDIDVSAAWEAQIERLLTKYGEP